MTLILSLIVLAFGTCLLLFLAKSSWPGWIGLPFFVVLASIVLDIGITPLAAKFFGYTVISVAKTAYTEEISTAIALIILNSFTISAGMVLAWYFWGRVQSCNKTVSGIDYSHDTISRAWKASLVMFLFGFFCEAYVLRFLLHDRSIFQLATERALFSAEDAVWDSSYNYARLLSGTMLIGAWGMILFSRKNRTKMKLAIIANSSVIILKMLHGGRVQLIVTLLAIMLLYHYGIRRMRLRHMVIIGILMLIGLQGIQLLRFQVTGFKEAFFNIFPGILVSGSLNETAFALRIFPDKVPFMGWGVLTGSLSHLFPTLGHHIPWSKNLWMVLVDYLFGGQNPTMGIGGEHYTPAAEHYMQFGLNGVIFLGLLFGLFYGRIFTWQKQQPKNLFLLMFTAYTFIAFFASVIDGKMIGWVGGMGFAALLPVGILAAITYAHRRSEIRLFGPLILCLTSFLLKRIFHWAVFDYTFAIALVPAYLMSINFISMANPANSHKQNT